MSVSQIDAEFHEGDEHAAEGRVHEQVLPFCAMGVRAHAFRA
jgi:hypothetical protein